MDDQANLPSLNVELPNIFICFCLDVGSSSF